MDDVASSNTLEPMRLLEVGRVRSTFTDPDHTPKQGYEGAPAAWLDFQPEYMDALRDLHAGDELLLLTWLHRADRSILRVHPRDDPNAPMRGVFSTRSQDRPNPIGIHFVRILAVETPTRIRVADLEAFDGTPVLDVKPLLRHER